MARAKAIVSRLLANTLRKSVWAKRLIYANGSAFRDEIDSVVYGNRLNHDQNSVRDEKSVYTLRRNTHRLEKGLIMRPRRPVFALDYIEETIAAYESLAGKHCDTDQGQGQLLQWSHDVLTAYFEGTAEADHPLIDKVKARFEDATKRIEATRSDYAPFSRGAEPSGISIEQLQALSLHRRSCRWYLPKPVPRELIDAAMDAARYAPSACNRQAFCYYVFDDPEIASEVGGIPYGTKGFNQQFPCFVVIVGNLAAYPFARDRHVIYIDGSLAAMAFQYGLEVQGLGSCCINWPDDPALNRRMRERLGLGPHERVVMCMSLGYPDPEGMVPYSQKKTLDEIRKYVK
ncbi:MAG: nitroreductase family protein [Planctomycetota bacterium]